MCDAFTAEINAAICRADGSYGICKIQDYSFKEIMTHVNMFLIEFYINFVLMTCISTQWLKQIKWCFQFLLTSLEQQDIYFEINVLENTCSQ